jgi:hypothetical protein
MNSTETEGFARKAEEIYANRWQASLEQSHMNEFVAIEPESGDYFLGKTLSEAIRAARRAYPDRLSHAMRVGHRTAIHLGVLLR